MNQTPENSPKPTEEQLEAARKNAKLAAAAFGEITSLLMRTNPYNDMPIKDLNWLVGPAVATGQFALAEAREKATGNSMPVAAVLWAMVSEDIDKRLTDDTSFEPLRLESKEWRSGDIPWIICAVGEQQVVSTLLQRLAKSTFKDNPARIRGRSEDGKIVVGRLRFKDSDEADEAQQAGG